MTETAGSGPVPQWDTADRMRKALRYSDVGVIEMADFLGVARSTVSNWINGRIAPSVQTLRLWALRCGVDYEWLSGAASPPPRVSIPGDHPKVRKPGICTAPKAPVLAAA